VLSNSPSSAPASSAGRPNKRTGAFLILEQHPQAILAVSDVAAVLDRGTVVHSGTAAELRAQPELLDRLLGVVR
jgi:ABC-type branched-subunit amino acid transport system ATPase component